MSGGKEDCIWVIGKKTEGKRPLGRPRHRLVDNIKMDLVEIRWGGCGLDWSGPG
jgi:hypothetical protein